MELLAYLLGSAFAIALGTAAFGLARIKRRLYRGLLSAALVAAWAIVFVPALGNLPDWFGPFGSLSGTQQQLLLGMCAGLAFGTLAALERRLIFGGAVALFSLTAYALLGIGPLYGWGASVLPLLLASLIFTTCPSPTRLRQTALILGWLVMVQAPGMAVLVNTNDQLGWQQARILHEPTLTSSQIQLLIEQYQQQMVVNTAIFLVVSLVGLLLVWLPLLNRLNTRLATLNGAGQGLVPEL